MESDRPVMKQSVNKFVIRESIKELQSKRRFDSLDDLAEAVVDDLFSEGFTVDPEERAKVATIVNEEGYTGRFAIDDALRRKIKNKKWLPLVSVVLAVLAFFLTTSASAVIEHYIQRPLGAARSPAPLTATFQVPEKAGELLTFKVTLSNVAGEPLPNVVVFASAGEVTQQYRVDPMDVGQSRTVSGALNVAGLPEGDVDFVAYVISGDFSLSSEPTTVAHQTREVAMATRNESRLDDVARGRPITEPKAAQGARRSGAAKDLSKASESAPAPAASANVEAQAAPPSAKAKAELAGPAAPAAAAPAAAAPAAVSSSLRTVANRRLSSKSEVERLAEATDPVSRGLLEAYAAAGDQLALSLLSRQK